ncbi:MAG: hypothetical protein KDK53_14235 [Maritimibacter sp.]|nr:hypothetical protein [Maritimibacter sp.]
MPIIQIQVAPNRGEALMQAHDRLVAAIETIVDETLAPAPGTLQLAISACLSMPRGRDVLVVVQHRASTQRGPEVRGQFADRCRALLERELAASVRVRVIAINSGDIVASDTPEPDA